MPGRYNEHVFTLVPICSMLPKKHSARSLFVCRLDQHPSTLTCVLLILLLGK